MNLTVIVNMFDASEGRKDDRRYYVEQNFNVVTLRDLMGAKERIDCRMKSLRKSYPDELGDAKLQVDTSATNRVYVTFAEVTDDIDASALMVHVMAAMMKTETVH